MVNMEAAVWKSLENIQSANKNYSVFGILHEYIRNFHHIVLWRLLGTTWNDKMYGELC